MVAGSGVVPVSPLERGLEREAGQGEKSKNGRDGGGDKVVVIVKTPQLNGHPACTCVIAVISKRKFNELGQWGCRDLCPQGILANAKAAR